jgi:hypothetical protein
MARFAIFLGRSPYRCCDCSRLKSAQALTAVRVNQASGVLNLRMSPDQMPFRIMSENCWKTFWVRSRARSWVAVWPWVARRHNARILGYSRCIRGPKLALPEATSASSSMEASRIKSWTSGVVFKCLNRQNPLHSEGLVRNAFFFSVMQGFGGSRVSVGKGENYCPGVLHPHPLIPAIWLVGWPL